MGENEKCAAWPGLSSCARAGGGVGYMPLADMRGAQLERSSLLLHSCCGPCSTSVIESLSDAFKVTVFFYNPNITDRDEYLKRRESQLLFINEYNKTVSIDRQIAFLEGEYLTSEFYEAAKGLEDAPEGGARCTKCFILRLEKTAQMARMGGYDLFGTTLTVSPHKNYPLISSIGKDMALKYAVSFLDRDFKKKDGFRRSIELSKKYGLYRQNYCGCEFSKWFEKQAEKENKGEK